MVYLNTHYQYLTTVSLLTFPLLEIIIKYYTFFKLIYILGWILEYYKYTAIIIWK